MVLTEQMVHHLRLEKDNVPAFLNTWDHLLFECRKLDDEKREVLEADREERAIRRNIQNISVQHCERDPCATIVLSVLCTFFIRYHV